MKTIFCVLLALSILIPTAYSQDSETKEELLVIETEIGNIIIDLNEEETPLHSDNFKKLAREGFLDSTTFHRVVPGFVIQGGDPLSKDNDLKNDGRGGPGYTIPAELGIPHLRGSVGAARQGDAVNPEKRSNGSQFYICLNPQPRLDMMGYTIFGQVVEGMEIVDEIASMPVEGQSPVNPVIMKRVYIKTVE
ncbi:MAG: peptidylprolyl isomerase [Calditrichaeota bacterium]|nr:peptidylprolyl isomerase [Calditrichota bacterium]RQV92980.1 MAG: peptidylprolyl isomerase [bacterium]RQW08062.1 MAG: peptidylprolyl isomerase [Calditrichota bacterium]